MSTTSPNEDNQAARVAGHGIAQHLNWSNIPVERTGAGIERQMLFFIEGKEQIASAGDVLHFPSNCWHGATMMDEEVVLIDIFSPLREDFLNGNHIEE